MALECKDLSPRPPQRMHCTSCSTYLDLDYRDFTETVRGVSMAVRALPTLVCPRCARTYLPDRSAVSIAKLSLDAQQAGHAHVDLTRNKIVKQFGFTSIAFIYDADDYYYMPGLLRPSEPGFLTPVFFNRTVLTKFDHLEEYTLRFASRTYGSVYTDDMSIDFGINPNDKVIFWLGDIAQLPLREQHYLRSENVPSDHRLGSAFYEAQIECTPAPGTEEDALLAARFEFLRAAETYFGQSISHLDAELLDAIRDFYPPATFTGRDHKRLSQVLNQLCVESLDSSALKSLQKDRAIHDDSSGSLKRLQALLASEFSSLDAGATLAPFFVTYDLRLAHAHLTSQTRSAELLTSVTQRLELDVGCDFSRIYVELLARLTAAYRTISTTLVDS